MADALGALPEMRDDPQFAIARLAPLMSAEQLKEMLALVDRIDDAVDWVRALPRLTERLPAESRAHAWRLNGLRARVLPQSCPNHGQPA